MQGRLPAQSQTYCSVVITVESPTKKYFIDSGEMSVIAPIISHPLYRAGNFTFNIEMNPSYVKVYDFERFDFVGVHRFVNDNLSLGFAILGMYLLSILVVQKWMETRAPFELRKPLLLWNVGLALLSVIMFLRLLPEIVHINKTYGFYATYCKQDYFNISTAFWLLVYSLSKIFEFGDTMFILLRKQKLTFLHVFHHSSVFIACFWGLLRVDPAGRYFALMNSFVHSVMYSYYGLKAAQVKLPRKLAMAVTSVQLIQFSTAIVINSLVVYAKVADSKPYCERPEDINVVYGLLAIVYLFLFGNFFVESYLTKKPVKSKAQ